MDRLGLPYYAGLLTAAQYHGAAHQRPQEFQVFLERTRRPLACSRVRVAFITRKRLKDVPVHSLNTPRGTLLLSTPEATALDLVGYQHRAGGLNQIATVLAELSERLDAAKLVAVTATAPPPWSLRLGFLLGRVGAAETAALLKAWVRSHARDSAALLPGAWRDDALRDAEWKLYLQRGRGARAVIPFDYITEWRADAPWVDDSQVEQGLVISRALVEIFSHPVLAAALALRGGTALSKLHLRPAARYSEDIDLVQTRAEPAGPIVKALREVLAPWLGTPKWKQNREQDHLLPPLRGGGLPPVPMKLKVEMNTREHFAMYSLQWAAFKVESRWFEG